MINNQLLYQLNYEDELIFTDSLFELFAPIFGDGEHLEDVYQKNSGREFNKYK